MWVVVPYWLCKEMEVGIYTLTSHLGLGPKGHPNFVSGRTPWPTHAPPPPSGRTGGSGRVGSYIYIFLYNGKNKIISFYLFFFRSRFVCSKRREVMAGIKATFIAASARCLRLAYKRLVGQSAEVSFIRASSLSPSFLKSKLQRASLPKFCQIRLSVVAVRRS